MSDPFTQAINDIFSDENFISSALFGSYSVPVIVSAIPAEEKVTQFGLDEGVSFTIQARSADLAAAPKRNDLITYQGTEYRVDRVELESSGIVWKIWLRSKSTR